MPRLLIGTVALVVVFAQPIPAFAQVAVDTVSPDRLTLGEVYVGSTVEASVRLFFADNDAPDARLLVKPPESIRVKWSEVGKQSYGTSGTFKVCDICVAVDTKAPGRRTGKILVRLGDSHNSIPVDVTILPADLRRTKVLVVSTPIHRFSSNTAKTFEPWLNLVKSARLNVSTLDARRNEPVLHDRDLSDYDVILVGCDGLYWLRDEEIEKLQEFVRHGGRLIVPANFFYRGTVGRANKILKPFGLSMSDTESAGLGVEDIKQSQITADRLTNGVRSLKFQRPSQIFLADKADRARARILVATKSDPNRGYLAVAKAGKGEVIALGISLWWNWIASDTERGADNALLLQNLLTKPRGGI
jgi:hypothetical protein